LRRCDRSNEAVALELEEARPIALKEVAVIRGEEAMIGQLVEKLKDLEKNPHGQGNIYI
jgi:hypothetical protein